MNRKHAMKIILNFFKNSPVVSANGFISRDLFNVNDKKSNFYMIGSMGLASSIGLGVALKSTKKKIFVFDGDGNILMNLGSLVTVGSLRPKNLIHILLDNSSHESTGGQPTNSSKINLEKLAKNTGYKTFKIKSKHNLLSILNTIKKYQGPVFLLVKISESNERSKRVSLKPKAIRDRIMRSCRT